MQVTSGIINGPQKVVVYGPEGIGKSTFMSKFPRPVFIDTEGSTKLLDVKRTPRPTSWTMLMDQVAYFKAHSSEYRTVIVDTADWAEQLCSQHVCSKKEGINGIEDFGYGKGHTYLAEEYGRFLNALEELVERGLNVGLTAHAQMRKFEQPDEMGAYDRWELKLVKKAAALVKEWADMVLFANYKTLVVNVDNQGAQKGKNKAQGGKRVMYTVHHPCWDAKNRHGLNEELPFDFAEIAQIFTSRAAEVPAPPPATPPREEPKPVETPPPDPPAPPEQAAPPPAATTPPPPNPDVPKALLDLMREYNVIEPEIQMAVASRGYFPTDTPIRNYPPDFVDGVLIGAWEQVYGMIEKLRKNELPF